MKDTTKRFSDRVDNYVKYRPSYPVELMSYLQKEFNITQDTTIADIGSGTGKFTELLLPLCKRVYAVEPNKEMRLSAEKKMIGHKRFVSIDGTSENTKIDTNTIDMITVAQAFHWFDLEKTKIEFQRIITQHGNVVIIANKRLFNTDFLAGYEAILQNSITEYSEVNHYRMTSEIVRAFFNSNYVQKIFSYTQSFDLHGLIGRLCSSSYTPKKETEEYKILEEKVTEIFNKYSENGTIDFNYETVVQSGKIN